MAVSNSRQSSIFGINDWKSFYQTIYREADFQSYSYETLRANFVNYIQTTYPETFNDYVESSEFVALLDVIAFMGQGLAFRNDLNARENFLDTAERRDSVVRLAELVSYTPKRSVTANGLLKITSISTNDNTLTDLNGDPLGNKTILWNDPANPNWLEQFNIILNSALIDSQRIGNPGNTKDILGVTTSEYSIRIPALDTPTVPFVITVGGVAKNCELVSMTSIDEDYLYEIPPAPTGVFNLLARNGQDGWGGGNTGFFFGFKQGGLLNQEFQFQDSISNRTIDINILGVNNDDVWLFQQALDGSLIKWELTDNLYSNNFDTKKLFSVKSRTNDQITLVFGDGVFSEIPQGRFIARVRSSSGESYIIDPISLTGVGANISYVNKDGQASLMTVSMALPFPNATAQARESLENIKLRAPTRFYTQNRMVNGEDYNNFPYSLFSSIIKSKAVNRTSIGVSKNRDLLDPTGKYSSTVTSGLDGGLFAEEGDVNLTFSTGAAPDTIAFFTSVLQPSLLKATQYYLQNFPRYSVDDTTYWKTSVVESLSETGYFYKLNGDNENPVSVGSVSGTNLKYISAGALCKFVAPSGYYFDENNRLIKGIPSISDSTYIWSNVLYVDRDGSNSGKGSFANGTGPIRMAGYVPSGVIIDKIIPAFDNSIPVNIITQAIQKIGLKQDFSLIFDNKLLVNNTEGRWKIQDSADNYFVRFTSGPSGYSVKHKLLKYYFGSVKDVRFSIFNKQPIYDPFTGVTVQDTIIVNKFNTRPGQAVTLGKDYNLIITENTSLTSGYTNEFEVVVSSIDPNNQNIYTNPDFFEELTGVMPNNSNIGDYIFFNGDYIIPSNTIVYQYPTKDIIETVKYDYLKGQLFYAYSENKFYVSRQDEKITSISYYLVEQSGYTRKFGRQGFNFLYKHSANNSIRIDPGTSNIIDLYLVTAAYYNAYTTWIKDTSGRVVEPVRPNIQELTSEYAKVQDYKMLTDALVLNSAVFKPLFGRKAVAGLQGKIKVNKNPATTVSDSDVKSQVVKAMDTYFDINNWEFGATFYFSELSAYLIMALKGLISSAVLVSNDPNKSFGDLYEIQALPYEIFINAAGVEDVEIVGELNNKTLGVLA